MKLIYYVEYKKREENTAGPKAPNDIYLISQNLNFKNLTIKIDENENKLIRKLKVIIFWLSLFYKLKRNDIVIYQYPTYGVKDAIKFIPLLKKYKKIEFIAVIHDLDSLRIGLHSSSEIVTLADNLLLPMFDKIICHNNEMKNYLITKGFTKNQLSCIEIFDYVSTVDANCKQNSEGIVIAGNLSKDKSPYLYKLIDSDLGFKLNLFGPNFDNSQDLGENVEYLGSFKPDELPRKIEGKFGLVWDGDSIETCSGVTGNYLRYNNPHKTSLYLASGLPVIIWKEAAMAKFIQENNVGILVDNLLDIEKVLQEISVDEYELLKKNAMKIGEKLREGYYYRRVIQSCIGRGVDG